MHCWLLFKVATETGEKIIPWDLAHHLKWGVSEFKSCLNPAGGRRISMSFGRGLNFKTPKGNIEVSHFSEPLWLFPDGRSEKSRLVVDVIDQAILERKAPNEKANSGSPR